MMISSDRGSVRHHTSGAPEKSAGHAAAAPTSAHRREDEPQHNPPGQTLARMAQEERRRTASEPDPAAVALGGTAGAQATLALAHPSHATADAAARAALDRANPMSVQDNLEYGGKIFRDGRSGRYTTSAPRAGTDQGFDLSGVLEPPGKALVGDYHTHGDYSVVGPHDEAVRTSDPQRDDFNSDRFSRHDHQGIRHDATGRPGYAGYLGTPAGHYRRYTPDTRIDTRFGQQPSFATTTLQAARGGAAAGAAVNAGLHAAQALRDGQVTSQEARDVATTSARGAVIGGSYALAEHGLARRIDRTAGIGIERVAAGAATRAAASDAGALGALARAGATRLSGAGAAGAVVSTGLSAYEHRAGLARGDSQAIGQVAGDTVVGASAALAGAAAGAAIGSAVPVLGTAVGAVVGLGVGAATDYVMHAGGVDQAVGQAVSRGVDAAKGAAHSVAGWFGD